MSNLALPSAAYARHTRLDRLMVYSVLGAGTAAGLLVSPELLFVTPVIALGLIWASHRAAPPKTAQGEASEMPARVEAAIHDAVTRLPTGDARRLLGDVVRQARPLFGQASSHFDASSDEQVRREAADLVLAACDTALELSELDALLASDERARHSRDPELVERLTSARALIASRLSEAANALGAMYASGVEHGTRASDFVAELTSELAADAAARRNARAEMEVLLGVIPISRQRPVRPR